MLYCATMDHSIVGITLASLELVSLIRHQNSRMVTLMKDSKKCQASTMELGSSSTIRLSCQPSSMSRSAPDAVATTRATKSRWMPLMMKTMKIMTRLIPKRTISNCRIYFPTLMSLTIMDKYQRKVGREKSSWIHTRISLSRERPVRRKPTCLSTYALMSESRSWGHLQSSKYHDH